MDEDLMEMLNNLKQCEENADSRALANPDAGFQLSKMVQQGKNWRMIASEAYAKGYIRYPNGDTFNSVGRITKEGIKALSEAWLTIENDGERVILKKCSREAEGEIVIPEGVTEISDDGLAPGECGFEFCDKITSVIIPNSVTTIGIAAFRFCASLSSVKIPDSVTSIGKLAFHSCLNLKSVEIGNSVRKIGDMAFLDCSGLTSMVIPDSVTSIGDNAFDCCDNLKSIIYKGIAYTNIDEAIAAINANGKK